MSLHVIVGAGAVGTATAQLLAERGERVRVISRRGSGPEHPAIERVSADATDAARLTELSTGAAALYNCANPDYHRWLTDWPPLHTALLTAAERGGAVLATVSNLYPYGPGHELITAQTPLDATHPKLRLRGQMWLDALALHKGGRIRATEVRPSDYLEARSILTFALAKPILTGKRAYCPAPLDVPHSWSAIADVARTLVAVGTDERAWGEAWLVPTNPALTIRQLAQRFAAAVGAPAPKLSTIPYPVMWTAGLFSPMIRELRTTRYQFTRPFVIDSSVTERTLGLHPTELDTVLKSFRAP
jgi:nucleoside-diphosphate-sugar epimerase